MSGRKSSINPQDLTIRVTDIRFKVEKRRKKGKTRRAVATIDYERAMGSSMPKAVQVRVTVISLWVDSNKNNAAKAFLKINPKNLQDKSFARDIRLKGLIPCPNQMSMMCDENGIIRYGPRPEIQYEETNQEDWSRYYFYNTKEKALRELIDKVSQYKQVGGLELISLRSIPKSVLEEVGLEEIKDVVGRGVSMWKGNVNDVLSHTSESGYFKRMTEVKENATSFLEVLDRELSVYSGN